MSGKYLKVKVIAVIGLIEFDFVEILGKAVFKVFYKENINQVVKGFDFFLIFFNR